MRQNNRLRFLIGLLGIVLALRFVLTPWVEWIAEKHEELQVLTDRLERSDSVLANKREIRLAFAEHSKNNASLRSRFPVAILPNDYRIKVQQHIGEIATTSGLTVQSFEWLVESEVDAAGMRYVRSRFTISGSSRGLAEMHAKLESEYPNLLIQEVSFGAGGLPVADADTVGQNLTLVGDFFIASNVISTP
jgi:hypothetical protein